MPVFSQLAPGIRRLVAPNPSMMTGPGTNTYLFGCSEIAVLDPGPLIESHLQRIQDVAEAPIKWIVVTHTHPDHSPAAAVLAKRTGAALLGMRTPDGEHQDETFWPHRVLEDGDTLTFDGSTFEVIHTPGHASNHICLRHLDLNWTFTGDHVIDGSTVVINPPDGNMRHYLQSLARLRELNCIALAPGHGELIQDPEKVISWIIDHRLEREAKVARSLHQHPNLSAGELVPYVYGDVDNRLYRWAERSLLAHLLKLENDGFATLVDGQWSELASKSDIA